MEGRHPRSVSAAFVGRDLILADLRGLVGETLVGRGHLALITGEPGIGKTSLVLRLAEELRSEEVTVLWGACWEGDGAPVLWPWIQVLRALMRQRDTPSLLLDLGTTATDLLRLLHEVQPGAEGVASMAGDPSKLGSGCSTQSRRCCAMPLRFGRFSLSSMTFTGRISRRSGSCVF
jgi:hypothetical protein